MTNTSYRDRIDELSEAVWTFAAICAAVESGLLETLSAPQRVEDAARLADVPADLAGPLLDVLVAAGVVDRSDEKYTAEAATLPKDAFHVLRAQLRSTDLQSGALVDNAKRRRLATGWSHTDPELLQAQGEAGRGAAREMALSRFAFVDGLDERLRGHNGTFLDVGLGVGVIAIEMCRAYPRLNVVGLEPAEAPRRAAAANIARAELTGRIEVQAQRVEELADVEAYDLVHLPQVFLSGHAFETGLANVHQALRPGGWLMLSTISVPGDGVAAALARLRNTLWGGGARYPGDVAERATQAGFTDVRIYPVTSTVHVVLARRPVLTVPSRSRSTR